MVRHQIDLYTDGALGSAIARALSTRRPALRINARALHEPATAELAIVALERSDHAALLALQDRLLDANRPSLFITLDARGGILGPVCVPGLSACHECRESTPALALNGHAGEPAAAADTIDVLARACARRVCELFDATLSARCFVSALVTGADAVVDIVTVAPRARCTRCSRLKPATTPFDAQASVELARLLEQENFASEFCVGPTPDGGKRYRRIGILGGGTAGYLAALLLRRRMPELEITLLESSRIPIIGVGEATTPDMVRFLHSPAFLGLDIVDFHRRVRPTFKLGIRFTWGRRDTGEFSFPFQFAPAGDGMWHDGRLADASVAACLMNADRLPLFNAADGSLVSLLDTVRFAYHLDNVSFVRYLQEVAAARGVRHLDVEIRRAVVQADGCTIDHLVAADGTRFDFDLYLDASGFRSVLMGDALRSPFIDFSSSLPADSAVVAGKPSEAPLRPYTQAVTFDSGWCWSIPFEHGSHVGYVHASSHIEPEAALRELRAAHPDIGEARHLRFRSGRRADFFKGNVVALGNAHAFVEPLESTALHMLVHALELLVNHFPRPSDEATKTMMTRRLNSLWDELRWFLSVHYRFNDRRDTAFWRDVRGGLDIDGARARLALFEELAPLTARPSLVHSFLAPDFFAGDSAFDAVLLGQGVAHRPAAPWLDAHEWQQRVRLRRAVAASAVDQASALPRLRGESSALLRAFVEQPTSWLHQALPR